MKVTEITVSVGVTRSLGKNTYEFARIDVSNKATFDAPIETDSPEYKKAHRILVASVQLQVEKAEQHVMPEKEEL